MKTSRLVLGSLLVFTLGCEKKSSAAEVTSAPPGLEAPAEPVQSPEDRAKTVKLNAAIECMNRHSGDVFENREKYLSRDVDPDKGPEPGKEPLIMGMAGLTICRNALADASAVTPAMPELDAPSRAYLAALSELETQWTAIDSYYKTGEWRTDGSKKAGELHAKVMASFKVFSDAHEALSGKVGAINRKMRLDDVAAREKAGGRKLDVIVDRMMLEAESLVDVASEEPAKIVAADLDAKIAAYAPLVDELSSYAAAHPDEAKTRSSLTNLLNYARTFLGASRAVAAKVHEKAQPAPSEHEAVNAQYNFLVTNYNNH